MIGSSTLIGWQASGRTYSDVQLIPHRRVGLVLGCVRLLPGGLPNPYFSHRIAAAAELYGAGKVDYLLVSGENYVPFYDEANDMKASLVEAGVPADRIYCDHASFRTLDSVVRARQIFGLTEITVVSQAFHNRRAIFIARHNGVDAIGFNAEDAGAYESFKTLCWEQLARVDAVLDVFLLHPQPMSQGPKVATGSPG